MCLRGMVGVGMASMAALSLCLTGCADPPRRAAAAASRPAVPSPASARDDRAVSRLRDDFEGDAQAEFWRPGGSGSGRYAPGAVVLAAEQAHGGRRSARITVRIGDVAQLGGSRQATERAELDSGKYPLLNRDVWYGYSFLIPPGLPLAPTRRVISQWKQSRLEGSPTVAQRFVAGRHDMTIRDLSTMGSCRAEYNLRSIQPGRWNDMIYRIRFATDSHGCVEAWMNGAQVMRFDGSTADAAAAAEFYRKVGLYRDSMSEPMTIYFDHYAMGASYAEVDPAR